MSKDAIPVGLVGSSRERLSTGVVDAVGVGVEPVGLSGEVNLLVGGVGACGAAPLFRSFDFRFFKISWPKVLLPSPLLDLIVMSSLGRCSCC